ncbi:MAG: prolyl oligopeptidase family serine peptidase [Prochlorococcus sp.]|nr:prolyl oligopeptidase family serine peptidase [Prochlorococcaceae cyanobacterium ETNP18_MAG_14]
MYSKSHNQQNSSKPVQHLSAECALGRTPSLKEPRLIGDWVLWLEQRPQERGRTTALIRPWGQFDCPAQELTPAPVNLRTRVHDYGGGVVATAFEDNQLLLAWIDANDGGLWFQRWQGFDQVSTTGKALTAINPPIRLSCLDDAQLADGLIDLQRQRWLGVMEVEEQDWLVTFSLNHENQPAKVLHRPADFAGYATLSPDGSQLAWVEWQQPAMPWEASQLWWASLDSAGLIANSSCLAGSRPLDDKQISVFQPFWLPNGELVVSEDSSGWWNLMLTDLAVESVTPTSWRHPWPMAAETGMPQWVYGMRTSAWDGEQILTAICDQGSWQLSRLANDGQISNVDQPFDDLSGLQAQAGRAVAIASNATTGPGLLELDLNSGCWKHTPASEPVLSVNEISVAEPLWFEGSSRQVSHAWYYPPINGSNSAAPLLVKSHSGPTSMASCGLNLGIQFWTSRGWGVVDVNYGGSTGFGRAYRERLRAGWGEQDVKDCAEAARALVDCGKADSTRIAIEGGSAGGFTTLACLCFTDVFRVGACRYAVSDLSAMAEDTHRFEARYLDSLVGSWPEQRQLYENRSPLLHANRIQCPVIFFQGLQDKVVPPEQTERMAAALRSKGIPVEVHIFEQEGHGFRDSAAKIKVLEATEHFFRTHLKL